MTDAPAPSFSSLIVYADESGDHGPVSPEFPVFVLAFCIFSKGAYAETVTTNMHRFKFKHFGHDGVVLHEREIRKATMAFKFLQVAERRAPFLEDMNALIESSPFTLVASVINKQKLRELYVKPFNPYFLAVKFGLERIEKYREALRDKGTLHVVFESRGKKEDDELELEFRRVCRANQLGRTLDMEPVFVKKEANHCGVQIADLVARPVGLQVLRPDQPNRAWTILETKFRRSPAGQVDGWGLKCFP